MALKLRLVHADILDPDTGLIAIGFDDPVDQQKRIAMRQRFQEPLDIIGFENVCHLLIHRLASLR